MSCIQLQCLLSFLSHGIFPFIFPFFPCMFVHSCKSHLSVPKEYPSSSHAHETIVKLNA